MSSGRKVKCTYYGTLSLVAAMKLFLPLKLTGGLDFAY